MEIFKYVFDMDLEEFLFCKYCLETVIMDEGFYEYHNSVVTLSVIFSYLKLSSNNEKRKKEINSKVFILLKNHIDEFKDCLNKMVRHLDAWIKPDAYYIFKFRYDLECEKMNVQSKRR